MELFAWCIAALPGGNGVLLGMDFIYQVAVCYPLRRKYTTVDEASAKLKWIGHISVLLGVFIVSANRRT